MYTFKQFANNRRREVAIEYDITLKEATEAIDDIQIKHEYHDYVTELAKEGVQFSKQFLDKFHALYGDQSLRLMLKWYPNAAPKYYVFPWCRDIVSKEVVFKRRKASKN